ncbi:MAG: hypothetical protein K2O41_01865 [Clostridia bacterium]|nr:hypothetical protein [Clostridia bacterium]
MTAVKSKFKSADVFAADGAVYISCRKDNEGIAPALSAEEITGAPPSGVVRADFIKGAGVCFLYTATELYYTTNLRMYTKLFTYTGQPFTVWQMVDGVPNAVAVTKGNTAFSDGTKFSDYMTNINLYCGVVHCGRLFAAQADNRQKLVWSGTGGVRDWEQGMGAGGYLYLDPDRGDMLDILEFGEKLVLIREYGLTVVNMFGSPENFSVSMTDTDTDLIVKNTACVVGGKLYFFTKSGLCSFDGSRVHLVEHAHASGLTAVGGAVEFDGKYFAVCQSGLLGKKAILCYDTENGCSYFIDLQAEALCSSDGVYAFAAGKLYKLKEGGGWTYTSGRIDFGTAKKKTVTEISAQGADGIELICGTLSRVFKDFKGAVRPRMRGACFTVKLTGTGAVKKVTATAEVTIGI